MAKYVITLGVVGSMTVIVEGETVQKAIEEAFEQTPLPCLCGECAKRMTVEEFSDEVSVESVQ